MVNKLRLASKVRSTRRVNLPKIKPQDFWPVILLLLVFVWALMSNQVQDFLEIVAIALVLAPVICFVKWLISKLTSFVWPVIKPVAIWKLFHGKLVWFSLLAIGLLLSLIMVWVSYELIMDEIITVNYAIYYFTTDSLNYNLNSLNMFRQVLPKVLSHSSGFPFSGWFHESIHDMVYLLHDNFRRRIPAIVMTLLAITVAVLLRRVQKLSKKYSRCVAEKQKLETELLDVKLKLLTETEKVQQEVVLNKKLKLILEEEKDKKLCGICQDGIKTILLLPCNHMCLCKQCLDGKKWKKCPICRQEVHSTAMIYM